MSNDCVAMFGRVPSRGARSAYTLLEVLVIIGIIALLVTILLTALSRAREAGRRTTCMNNLGTIAHAVLMYANDNENFFPFAAARVPDDTRTAPLATPEGHVYADWIYWQSTSSDKLPTTPGNPPPQWNGLVIDDVDKGGIGKYLSSLTDQSSGGLSILRCPSDQRLYNSAMEGAVPGMPSPGYPTVSGGSPYPFSYVLNFLMCSGNFSTNGAALSTNGTTPPYQYIAKTLSKVKDPATKILVYEEDPRTITDGSGVLIPVTGNNTRMLCIRHNGPEIDDSTNKGLSDPRDPDSAQIIPPGQNQTTPQLQISNAGSLGNAAFCDGHAEVLPRGMAHLKDHWAPDPAMFPTYP